MLMELDEVVDTAALAGLNETKVQIHIRKMAILFFIAILFSCF